MDRRRFSLLGLSFGLSLIPAAGSADGHQRPVAIIATGQGQSRTVLRLYQGRGATSFLLHLRQSGEDMVFNLETDPDAMLDMRDISRGTNFEVVLEGEQFPVAVSALEGGQRQAFTIDGALRGEMIADTAFGLVVTLFMILLIVNVMGLNLILEKIESGYVTTAEGQRIRAAIASLQQTQSGGSNIIADPSCDGPPVLLC
ncbi:hypothetical protein [Gymnodinialimonas sp. 57CJ19]|uniref:hypothetical protein n=1 Tax=Gymnodinialimonas sp. 57CJ19 TaxID=3138498 RepID=UPI003134271D